MPLDWTEFDAADLSTNCLSLVTSHGLATPLMWKTAVKSKFKKQRNDHEDDLLSLFAELRPATLKQGKVLADRGFGDQKLYEFLTELGRNFIIRFRGIVLVEAASGECRPAKQWLPKTTRLLHLSNPLVNADKTHVALVECVKAKGMKDFWFLATSRADLTGEKVIKCYGRRFTSEENFRDTKDIRFGMALSSTHISVPERRDRLWCWGQWPKPCDASGCSRRTGGVGPNAQGQHGQPQNDVSVPSGVRLLVWDNAEHVG